MNNFFVKCVLVCHSFQLFGSVNDSILPSMDEVYTLDFGKRVNRIQKESMEYAIKNQSVKLRIMTYNMLYNMEVAEERLPLEHRWNIRKDRLTEYLLYSNVDVIGSQELQEDQLEYVMKYLNPTYGCYGVKTRENEGRKDVNAIFFNKERLELVDAQTIPYKIDHYENGFTVCYFKDKIIGRDFVVINTKFTWGNVERRLAEASQLNQYISALSNEEPVILLGDFNTFPCTYHQFDFFLDGDYVEQVLTGEGLREARKIATFGHFGPICTLTHSKSTFEPFSGAELAGYILDHIFVNDKFEVFVHGIDTLKVEGEFPSDHFPVIADLYMR